VPSAGANAGLVSEALPRSAVVRRLDITPPGGLNASALDELAEGTDVTLAQAADEAELVANLLCDAFGVELELGTVTPGWPTLVRFEADRGVGVGRRGDRGGSSLLQ
jgi:predicted dinucleotide-binding enzyme